SNDNYKGTKATKKREVYLVVFVPVQRLAKSRSARKCTDEGAALTMNRPRYPEIGSVVLVELSYSRHRVVHLCKRLVIDIFIAAKMVLLANHAGLNAGEVAGLNNGFAVVPVVAAHLH